VDTVLRILILIPAVVSAVTATTPSPVTAGTRPHGSRQLTLNVVSIRAIGRDQGPWHVGDAVWVQFAVTNHGTAPDTINAWSVYNSGIRLRVEPGYVGHAVTLNQEPGDYVGIIPQQVLRSGQVLNVDVPLADCIRVLDAGIVPVECEFLPCTDQSAAENSWCDPLKTHCEIRFARRQFFWERWQTTRTLSELMSSPIVTNRMFAIRSANVLEPSDAARLYGRAWSDPEERVQMQALTEIRRCGFSPDSLAQLMSGASASSIWSVRMRAGSELAWLESKGGRRYTKQHSR